MPCEDEVVRPTRVHDPVRPDGPRVRLLICDEDEHRGTLLRRLLLWHGVCDADLAISRDDALDTLGMAQLRYDAVVVASPQPENDEIDVTSVLYRHRAPVRLVHIVEATPPELTRPERLMGSAAIIDALVCQGVVRALLPVLNTDDTIASILDHQRVPSKFDPHWAEAVYRARPGEPFRPR